MELVVEQFYVERCFVDCRVVQVEGFVLYDLLLFRRKWEMVWLFGWHVCVLLFMGFWFWLGFVNCFLVLGSLV